MAQAAVEIYNPHNVLNTSVLIYDSLGKEAVTIMNHTFRGNANLELDTKRLAKDYPISRLNLYQTLALGQIVSQITGYNTRLLTPAYLQLLRAIGHSDIGNAQDLGVVAYPSGGPNEEIRQHLITQAADRKVQLTTETASGSTNYLPVAFHSLEVVPDGKFPHGVRLDMGEMGVAYPVPALSTHFEPPKYSSADSQLVKSGFPAATASEGDRTLANANNGLRRVFMDGNVLYACGSMLTFPDISAGLAFINVPQKLVGSLEKILKSVRSLDDLSEEGLMQLISGLK